MALADVTTNFVVWALAFGFGSIFSWLVWLTMRHLEYAKPAYEYIAGDDIDGEGHEEESTARFDELDDAHASLATEVRDLHDDVERIEQTQDIVLTNQETIADGLDIDLDRPRFYRGSSDDD